LDTDFFKALLLAGRETTAALLSWIFVLLATNPRVFNKLRTIVLEDFGSAESGKKVDFASIKSCRYLQHVISETLRLYPPVPLNNRQAVRDTILPVGGGADGERPVAVRKGQIVGFTVYWMHRRPDLWGEDADQFRPERFDGRKLDWSFLPFSGGPRICLGRKLTLLARKRPVFSI
jgi:cytochrome P450